MVEPLLLQRRWATGSGLRNERRHAVKPTQHFHILILFLPFWWSWTCELSSAASASSEVAAVLPSSAALLLLCLSSSAAAAVEDPAAVDSGEVEGLGKVGCETSRKHPRACERRPAAAAAGVGAWAKLRSSVTFFVNVIEKSALFKFGGHFG